MGNYQLECQSSELELRDEFLKLEAEHKQVTKKFNEVKAKVRDLVVFEEDQATAETDHFKLTRSRKVEFEQDFAKGYFVKHKASRGFFKLGVSVADVERLDGFEYDIEFNSPTIKVK